MYIHFLLLSFPDLKVQNPSGPISTVLMAESDYVYDLNGVII